ncbi:hypothetical protein [Methylicorpusculum sp.]|uniref:hypothetical protein n=1 Tax=Methylicorpusculum sp. TaxID=2713644 RepID=UPI0027310448|nr:hypothetical protein [Methylicorpusculum sp.]MDP2177233.1 hypothetical protein [Methylicorpusculum sp.]MDP3531158.1 hypothetical protein [Methylicorpusculum sp.]MDZ4153665.1 hypothetical protein [Methylicorpusculum sp.]
MFDKDVEHVDAEIKQCPTWDATIKGWFPDDLLGPLRLRLLKNLTFKMNVMNQNIEGLAYLLEGKSLSMLGDSQWLDL